MTERCPNCGFVDKDREEEHGYELSGSDSPDRAAAKWREGEAFETSLSMPGKTSKRCPRCGETL